MRAPVVLLVATTVAVACGPWSRVGREGQQPPGTTVPQLFAASTIYRTMGLLVAGAPLPFVAAVRYLDGGAPDSTLAVIAISLPAQSLRFRREASEFVARYRVDLSFRPDSGPARQLTREETVRVRSFQETLRVDESIIFQQMLRVRPGPHTVSVTVRDQTGTGLNRAERNDTVPSFGRPGLGNLIPVYEGDGRASTTELPQLVSNPRATLPYGTDSLRTYVEGYGLTGPTPLALRVVDAEGTVVRTDTVTLAPPADGGVARAIYVLSPGNLPVGRLDLEAGLPSGAASRLPFLLSFSGQYVITNYAEMVNLLRYFERPDAVAKLRDAPAEERASRWEEFWRETDPVAITPENEALEDYFRRVQQANLRFPEEGSPGWLTDRGEVFITLGDPDDVLDQSSGLDRSGRRIIRWSYNALRLVVFFEDDTGFGRFRLTPSSRAEYQRVLSRVRRAQ